MCKASDRRPRPKPISMVNLLDTTVKPSTSATKNDDDVVVVSAGCIKEDPISHRLISRSSTSDTENTCGWEEGSLDETIGTTSSCSSNNEAAAATTKDSTSTLPTVRMEEGISTSDSSFTVDDQRTTTTVTGAPYTNVNNKYYVSPTILGKGNYGIVRKCLDRTTKERYAIKSIDKSMFDHYEYLRREIDLLRELDDHPNIIKLVDVCEDETHLHIITELCMGGELFDKIIEKSSTPIGHFTEQQAANIIYQILDAVSYCHSKRIVHRDLKPENFLFVSSDKEDEDDDASSSQPIVKLIDFGLSKKHDTIAPMTAKVGTPYYIAPEVLQQAYTRSCDLWSIGTIAYTLLCGYPPFYGDTDDDIFDSILDGHFDFPEPEWTAISYEAKRFVCALLEVDPRKRMTVKEAKNHRWLKRQLGVANQNTTTCNQEEMMNSNVQCLYNEDKVDTTFDNLLVDAGGDLYII